MCGICGIASAQAPLDVDRLRAMSQTLFHRGPDSEGVHTDERVGIAARRLAIIDLAGGDQPIAVDAASSRDDSADPAHGGESIRDVSRPFVRVPSGRLWTNRHKIVAKDTLRFRP
jgi:hypothetical protein